MDYTPATMGEYVYPPWAEGIGWTLTMTSILVVIGYAIIYVIRLPGGSLLEVSKPRGGGNSTSVWVGMSGVLKWRSKELIFCESVGSKELIF